MSEYPQYPPPPPGQAAPPRTTPPSLQTAFNIVLVLFAVYAISTALTFVYIEDVAEASGSNLSESELDTAKSAAQAISVVILVVFGGLFVLLAHLMRKGANWARIVLTVLTGLGVLFGLLGLFGEQPVVLLIVGLVALILQIALLVFMWRKDASEFLTAPRYP